MKRDEAKIESPCSADWDAMTGDDARRYCGTCDKHVHNLSAMTEDAARAVVAKKNVCVRYSFHPRTKSLRHRPSRRSVLRVAAAATLSAGLALPAVASISTEPGEVGLLETVWQALTDGSESDAVQGGIIDTSALSGNVEPVEPVEMGEVMEVEEVDMGDIEPVQKPRPVRMGRVAAPRDQ